MTLTREKLEAALRVALTTKEGGRTYASKEQCEEITNTVITALELLLHHDVVVVPVEPSEEVSIAALNSWHRKGQLYRAVYATSPYKLED